MAEFNMDIDALLAKSFAGELLPEEAAVLEKWLEEDPANKAYSEEMQRVWSATGKFNEHQLVTAFDTEKALAKVKQQIHGNTQGRDGLGIWHNRFLLAAAASVALLAVAVYFLRQDTATNTMIAAERPMQDTLADGSLVTLNRASGLSIRRGFNRGTRSLQLQGEAYFEVQPDSSQVFTVEVQDLEISVLGTAFNVDNLTDPDLVTVTVTEGRVRLQSALQSAELKAGEAALYRRADGSITKSAISDPNFLSYQNRKFTFEETPLRAVIRRLEAVYGVPIAVENSGQLDCLLTARFSDLDLERVLDIIADSFSFELEQNNNGYLLKGAACAPQ